MNIDKFARLDLALMGDTEMQTFENVISLAISHLQLSPVASLSGSPFTSQAGLKGSDLINVKNMLERFADQFGWDKPQLEPSPAAAEQASQGDEKALPDRKERPEASAVHDEIARALRGIGFHRVDVLSL